MVPVSVKARDTRGDVSACGNRCPMCGSAAPAVFVHGHLQCGACGVNIDPCCGGAPPVFDDPVADERG